MSKKYEEQEQKLKRARIRLLTDNPFFGDLAYNMPWEMDDQLNPPTAATNGERIKFHPSFIAELKDLECVFVLAHEVMHSALLHTVRRGERHPLRWNIACDIVVNEMLIDSNVGKMIQGGIYEPDIYKEGNGKVEEIYELIKLEDYPQDTDNVEDGTCGAEETAATWKNRLQQAAQTAKKMGKLSGQLEAFVDELTTPKVSWRDKLRNFIMTTKGSDRTYAKRNRRHISSGLNLPGTTGEQMGELVFAIDCSGSTSDNMVAQCGAELRSIQEDLRPEKIHVIYFDSDVKKHEEFEPDDPVQAKVYGRGGTAFSPIFKFIEDNGIEPQQCLVATDLYCSDFGPEPDYPVMWCVMESSNTQRPWGDVLVID